MESQTSRVLEYVRDHGSATPGEAAAVLNTPDGVRASTILRALWQAGKLEREPESSASPGPGLRYRYRPKE